MMGKRIKDRNGNNDRNRKRQTMASKKRDVSKDKPKLRSNQN
jgi:hypothetical protein